MENIKPAYSSLSLEDRRKLMGHRSLVIWMTGLSGAGKSTLAILLEQQLFSRGIKTALLDGDRLRTGLSSDLSFSLQHRSENVRRVAEVAGLMKESGLVSIVSLISPLENDRRNAKEIIGTGFLEVFVDCPIEECMRRDVKGLYAKANQGVLDNFTGISSIYEPPQNPDLIIDTCRFSIPECIDSLLQVVLPLIAMSAALPTQNHES